VNCYFGRGDSPNRPRAVEVNRPYLSENGHERKESERFKSFTYEELTKRDKRVSNPNYFHVAGNPAFGAGMPGCRKHTSRNPSFTEIVMIKT